MLLQRKAEKIHISFLYIYYKYRHDTLAQLNSYKDSRLQQTRFVQERYTDYYSKKKAVQSKWFSGRCAVYTVITGGYDNLSDPQYINPEWDYYCLTDTPEKYHSDCWQIKRIENDKLSPVLLQRYTKFCPFDILNDYDYSIYVDGKMIIKDDLGKYITTYSRGASMLCFPHPSRKTISEEAEAIISYNKSPADLVRNQIDTYYKDGYKDELPLLETACLVRSHRDDNVKTVMNDWWSEVKKHTVRDQLSICYVCYKNDYLYDISDLNIYNCKFFIHQGHI